MKKINKSQLKADLANILTGERQKAMFSYRFGLDSDNSHTLEETGKMYGVTRERVRQVENKVIEILGGLDKYYL